MIDLGVWTVSAGSASRVPGLAPLPRSAIGSRRVASILEPPRPVTASVIHSCYPRHIFADAKS